MEKIFSAHEASFDRYASEFIVNDPIMIEQYKLKILHTKKVIANAEVIGRQNSCFQNKNIFRALLLSALYHDIGRFEQLKQYRTFSDALSCNHGQLGVKILHRLNLLKEEKKEVQKIVTVSVCLHNKFILPSAVKGDAKNVLLAIRDADKLDILRVLEGHLGKGATPDSTVVMHLRDERGKHSPIMLDNMEKNNEVSFKHMRYVNDFRLLLCHWVGEFNYSTTKKILKKNNHLIPIIEGIEGLPDVQKKALAYVHKVLGV